MKIIGKIFLNNFKQQYTDACSQVDSWIAEAEEANWETPQDIRKRYASASFLNNNHVIFNIKGNKYRLKVQVSYKNQILDVVNIGTHNEYMRW